MTLPLLLDDALSATATGFVLRLSLPWIRSLPLASVTDLEVTIDAEPAPVKVGVAGASPTSQELAAATGWWFIQDRLELHGDRALAPGAHDVRVSFTLLVPYLQAGPAGPVALPFRAEQVLRVEDPVLGATASGDRPSSAAPLSPSRGPSHGDASAGREDEDDDVWTLSASAFNWTSRVIRADQAVNDIAVGIIASGVSKTIEIEAGQVWRSFPEPADAEVDELRERVAALGGAVTIVGASLDDWALPPRRRTEEERLTFLLPQLRAAARVGALGVRVPFGQAGRELLRRVQPVLEDLGLILYEEIQGQQALDVPAVATNLELLQQLADPRIRVLIDISMLMPSLPLSYLEELRRGGIDEALLRRLEHEWRAPETHTAVVAALRGGDVPPAVHTLFMNLLVRFGRSQMADLEPLLPLTAGVHLKFWDLEDSDGRVSRPIGEIGAALSRTGFTGTLTSEWGGHEWLDADPAEMTRAHLGLARDALSAVSATR
ncbi:sugar phosphate isomerase/epimerase [Microbacterium timonense]|uniref:sugar phosphate isomerase/epimerase n=1 Tax=Microbacterium timonense TaxID=2086576 RepID=UPI001F2A2985|nr:sugar phosphate isomerase/epimerase [Microbacterium timonense]